MSAPSVLIVDDRPESLVAMEAALSPLGYRTVTAASGEDALRRLLVEDFSLVILDVQMPGIDGFETARAIKQRDRSRDIPILFLTAISREDAHRMSGYESGAVDYLFKPISPELLRAKVTVFVQLREQHRQLIEQQEELEQRANELEQFTYIVSHDLQEPLRAVAGYLDLIADATGADHEDAQQWIDRAGVVTREMGDLVRDLLVMARAAATRTALVPVDVAHAARSAVEHVSATIARTGATVDVAPGSAAVLAVESELVQVLQNLIANAIRHHGPGAPAIRIGTQVDGADVEIIVSDNGPGVPAGDLDRVFGAFERVGSSPYPGTGLGLAICRRIVERLGGRIWMTSADEGDGAAVHVRLTGAGS